MSKAHWSVAGLVWRKYITLLPDKTTSFSVQTSLYNMSLLCACVSLGGLRMISQSSWKPHKPLVKYTTERQIGLYIHAPPSSIFSTQFFNYPYQWFTVYLIFMCALASISKCTSFSRSEAKKFSEPLLHRKQSNLVEFSFHFSLLFSLQV